MNDASPPISPPPANPGPGRPTPKDHRVPHGTAALGMYLFLAALAMLFLSSMLGYVVLRWNKTHVRIDPVSKEVRYPATAPPFGEIHLPTTLWLSTIVILASSVTMHFALANLRRERQSRFRSSLIFTLVLAILFLLVQTPSLASLILNHFRAGQSNTVLGFIFLLVLLHALHVVGGIIPLAVVTYRAGQGKYDHENLGPVQNVARYWHFLDGVWLFMFAVLLATR